MNSDVRLLFLILLSFKFSLAQPEDEELIVYRDTSFTVFSAFTKEQQKFPFIEIAKPPLSDSIIIGSNLVYVEYGKRKLRLDIFYPKDKSQKYPAVILVHGGGWRSGDKSQQFPMAEVIASPGFVTAAVA